jgi:hypothetical protein
MIENATIETASPDASQASNQDPLNSQGPLSAMLRRTGDDMPEVKNWEWPGKP